jgi:hypothetical protein
MVCGVFGWWEVGGGGGGEMVLGSGGEGRMVFAGDGFAFCFRLGFFKRLHPKKNRLFISLSKIQIVITFTASAFTSPSQKKNVLFR